MSVESIKEPRVYDLVYRDDGPVYQAHMHQKWQTIRTGLEDEFVRWALPALRVGNIRRVNELLSMYAYPYEQACEQIERYAP